MKYQVQRVYSSSYGGPWGPGKVLTDRELLPYTAEQLNRSSPGLLKPVPMLKLVPEVKERGRVTRKTVRNRQKIESEERT